MALNYQKPAVLMLCLAGLVVYGVLHTKPWLQVKRVINQYAKQEYQDGGGGEGEGGGGGGGGGGRGKGRKRGGYGRRGQGREGGGRRNKSEYLRGITGREAMTFQDQYFAPVLKTFRKVADGSFQHKGKHRFRSGRVPKAFVYIKPQFVSNNWLWSHFQDMVHHRCPFPCSITTNRSELEASDAVLIHLRSVQSRETLLQNLQPRDPSQPWVMFEPETHLQSNLALRYETLNGIFNRTFHHRRDSDVLMVHGFIVRRGQDSELLPPSWRREPELVPTLNRSKLAVAFISNCNDNSGRLWYIKALSKYVHVDIYGGCGSLKCGSSRYAEHEYRADTDPCMKMAAGKYLFFLAFENALCRDYVTEKAYNLLYYPMVPVVLGGADYSVLLPPNSYINAQHFTPQQLGNRLIHLAANPQEYQALLNWRYHYQPSTVGGARVLCDLCTQLHSDHFYSYHVYHNFYEWYVDGANCSRKTLL